MAEADPEQDPNLGNDDPPANAWPDDWRNQIAGEDEKALTQLERYKTPGDIWTKARALEQRISSGELVDNSPFPDKGTDEEKTAWRKSAGLPEAADQYEYGREVDDDQKTQLKGFMDYAFEKNMPAQTVQDMVGYFFNTLDTTTEAHGTADKDAQQATDDQLRSEWGNDYRGYINRVDNLIAGAGEAVEGLLDARLNGVKLRSNPAVMAFLLDAATAVDPVTTITPAGTDKVSAVADEIDQIKKTMREDRKAYNADEKMQARYRELLEAQSKLSPSK